MTAKTLKTYPLTVLTILAVTILSLAPIGAPEIAKDVPMADKWTHCVMYCGLALMFWCEYAWRDTHREWCTRAFWGAVFPVFWGGLMEVCQAKLTTYRSGDWLDFVADSIGVVVCLLIVGLVALTRKSRNKDA